MLFDKPIDKKMYLLEKLKKYSIIMYKKLKNICISSNVAKLSTFKFILDKKHKYLRKTIILKILKYKFIMVMLLPRHAVHIMILLYYMLYCCIEGPHCIKDY